jgi:hypothetical protein
MTHYVVFSSNQVQAYEFMAPIAAMCWQSRTEFKPVCMLTQTREHWDTPSSRVVVDMLDRLGVQKHYVGMISEPYRTSVQAQASRQHAPQLKCFQPEDYIMTMDVDALPVNGAWFSNVDWSKPCHARNASAWQYRWLTTFGFGATVAAWREFMGYEASGEIATTFQKNLDIDLTSERDTMLEWYFDEFLWMSRIKASRFYPDLCQFIERDTNVDRIDRGRWPKNLASLNGYIDVHAVRPAFNPENWSSFKRILELLIPNRMEDVCQYHERYKSATS